MSYLFPIAGADSIGISSYFVNLAGTKILFDCGANQMSNRMFPDYTKLIGRHLSGFDELDMIFISHAHFDHIGSFGAIAQQAVNARIYTTKVTKDLMRLQLLEFDRMSRSDEPEKIRRMKRCMMEQLLNRVRVVPVMKKIEEEQLSFMLYPAGHMAGAAMIYIEKGELSFLYTGDFSIQNVLGINQMNYNGIHPQTLLLNATNAYKYKTYSKLDYKRLEKQIKQLLDTGNNVLLRSNSIAKHLELFYALKLMKLPVTVYIHQSSFSIAEAFTNLGYQVITEQVCGYLTLPTKQHVLISQYSQKDYEEICVDKYSLHASFAELINLIYLYLPKKVFVVHYQPIEGALCFIEDINNQDRYRGEIVLCHEQAVYEF